MVGLWVSGFGVEGFMQVCAFRAQGLVQVLGHRHRVRRDFGVLGLRD